MENDSIYTEETKLLYSYILFFEANTVK